METLSSVCLVTIGTLIRLDVHTPKFPVFHRNARWVELYVVFDLGISGWRCRSGNYEDRNCAKSGKWILPLRMRVLASETSRLSPTKCDLILLSLAKVHRMESQR